MRALGILALIALALGAAFLYFHRPVVRDLERARREASLCVQERSTLKSRLSDLEAMLADLRRQSETLAGRIEEREAELADVQSTQDELLARMENEIAEGKIRVERLRGQLRVDVVDEILFDSGEATLKPAGRDVLERLASVLSTAGREIRVQGHTDGVPIRGRLAKTFATNWELSAARAVGVVRFLHEDAGLDPALLSASALSEYRPRATNETSEGRQKNRRIEILLLPREPESEPGPGLEER
jgi:chemotaxis protein MotB